MTDGQNYRGIGNSPRESSVIVGYMFRIVDTYDLSHMTNILHESSIHIANASTDHSCLSDVVTLRQMHEELSSLRRDITRL